MSDRKGRDYQPYRMDHGKVRERDNLILAYAVLQLACEKLENIENKGFQKVLGGILGNIETAQQALKENRQISEHLEPNVLLQTLNNLEIRFGLTLTNIPEVDALY